MKHRAKRLTSWLLTFVMVIGLLPAMTVHTHAYDCPECGQTFTCEWDEQLEYHNNYHKWKCDNCGECYGEETKCNTEDHHACGGDEHYCAGGHCVSGLDDSYLKCPADEYGTGCGGIDENRCLWCHEETDLFCCEVCPYASDFESHLCPDHGICPTECSGVGDDVHWDTSKYCCEDCGTCIVYAWEGADHTCSVHTCPCQCELCDWCGECVANMVPCDTCDAPCNCFCEEERCWTCGLCVNAPEYDEAHCRSCAGCLGNDVEYCTDEAGECEAVQGGTICKECNTCEYCGDCGWCIWSPSYDEAHCDDCGACHVTDGNSWCDEHDQCICVCDFCEICHKHLGDEEFSDGSHCESCMSCADAVSDFGEIYCPYCGGCGVCEGCFEDEGHCEYCEACEGGGNLGDEHCEECGACFNDGAERTECEECDETLCADCVGDVCEECGLCYANHAEECWSCGEPCSCVCDEDRCEECDLCQEVMEPCFTCGEPCGCVCEEDRCWDCGLCPTAAERQYGDSTCFDCGMCPCSCLCDPPMNVVAAVANKTMMMLRVYVQDFFDFVEYVPVSLMYLDADGEVAYKNCGLTTIRDDEEGLPYIGIYIPEKEADKYFGVRVGSYNSIYVGDTDANGADYELVGVYDELEREMVAYRCYPAEGQGVHEFEWAYGPHDVVLQLSKRAGYVGDMSLADGRGMVTLGIWPGYAEKTEEWIRFGENGEYPVNSQLLLPATDPNVKDAEITFDGKLTGYHRTFHGFNDLLSRGDERGVARGLVVTLPEDIYNITVICDGYAPYSAKLHVYNRDNSELAEVNGKYVATGDFRQDDNDLRKKFVAHGNYYYNTDIENLFTQYDMGEDMEFLFMNLKKSNTDTLNVQVDAHDHFSNKDIEVSVKRLGSADRQAYRLPVLSEDGVYFYGLPKGNYVVSAKDEDGLLYTTVLYNQQKAAKDPKDKKVNKITLGATALQGSVRLQFHADDPDFNPVAVLYTIKDARDRIWYVGGHDRTKYYASSEKWNGNPVEVTVPLPQLGRGEKFTVTAVAVEQNKAVDGVKADMKLQITNGLHGSASFAVANKRTLTVPVRLDKLDYGTLKARLVYETESGYKESGFDNNKSKLTYELYSESIDQVSANPEKFTPLAKIVSVPPEYGKTIIQLRDPEDGTLLDQFEERGLKPGEVERPKTGEFRSEVTFGNVAPGDYTLRVYGTNFSNKNLKGVSFYEYVTVEENQEVMANVLMGVGTGSASFEQTYTVTDTAGNPLVGAVVTVVRNDANGVPTYVDKYVTNGQGKVTVNIRLVDPKSVQNAYAHTIYCYAEGFNAGSTLLTDTTVNGTVVRGYAMASFGADSTTWLADSFFRWATNLEEIWGTGTYYNAAVLASVGNNYYDLISSETLMAIDDNVSAEDYGKLSKERNTLKNLEVEEKTFTMSAMAPQNVVAYTVPMNDETYTVSVPADTTLELHVDADGGVMTYNWYRKGHANGSEWVKMEDLEGPEAIFDTKYYTGVLIFEPVNLTDHPGYYYCEVVNDAGTATSAIIDVLVESIPLKGTAEIVGEPGIGMTLTAEPDVFLKNYPDANFRYQWQKKGVGTTYTDISGATEPTYTLPVEELGSQYRVIITSGSYEGELISRAVTSCKGENNNHPTTFGADVLLDQQKIALKGIAAGQEYVLITQGTTIDWAKAIKCTDANEPIIFENLEIGVVYGVYSRFFETELKKAGSVIVSQPRLAMTKEVKPNHVTFRASSGADFTESESVTDPTGRTYNAPVIQLGLGEVVYLDYFVTPDNYTRAYYDVLFNTFNGISSDVKVTKEGNQLKIQSTGTTVGETYVTAYRYEGGSTGSPTPIPIHKLNTNQMTNANYVNLVVKVGDLKTETVEIEPGTGGLPIERIDLSQYVIGGTAPYSFSLVSAKPSWISYTSNGVLSGTRPSSAAPTSFIMQVADNAARRGYVKINVGAVLANDSTVETYAEVGNIVRPSPGQNPAGIARFSHQSDCDESKTVVAWYELSANGEKARDPETGATLPALKRTDVFKKNTKYQLEITLTAASGKKFMLHDNNNDPDYAVINNEYVDYFYPGASNGDFTKVTMYTVYDTANCITDVDLYDLLYPIGGKTADVEYQIDANGKCVAQEQSVTSIWSGVSNGKFKADYTSEYDAWLYLEAEDGYWFATDNTADNSLVQVKINGEEMTVDYVDGHLYTSGGGSSNTDPSYNYNQQNELVIGKCFTKAGEITDGVFLYGYLLRDKQYLPSGGNRTTTEMPKEGGYAYYNAATKTLTLNNFTSAAVSDYYAITVIGGDLTVELIGANKLTSGGQFGISADNLTFKGSGRLTLNCSDYGIFLDEALTMESGRVEITSECNALWLMNPGDNKTDLTMNGGVLKLSVSSSYFAAIYSDDGKLNFVMNGGCLTASSEGYASGHYALSGTVNAVGSPNANGSEPVEGWNGVVSSYEQETQFKYIQLAHTSYVEPYFTSQPKNYRDTACSSRSVVAVFNAQMNVDAEYTWECYGEGLPQWMPVETVVNMGIIKASGYKSSSLRVECRGFDGDVQFRCKAVVGTETYTSEKAYMSLKHQYDSHEATTSDMYHISTCSVCGYRGQQKHTLVWSMAQDPAYSGKLKERCIDCGWSIYKAMPAADRWAVRLHPNYEGGGDAEVHFYNIGEPHVFTSSFAAARAGYRLIGWAYDPEAEEPIFAYSENVILGDAVNDLYAVWDHGISSIDIEITEPFNGVVPSYENAKLVGAVGLVASQPRWYDATNGGVRYLNAGEAFELGRTYGVAVNVWAQGDFLINSDAVATINGRVVDNDVSQDRTMATLRNTWTIEKEQISHVNVTAVSPKDGENPVLKANVYTDASADPVESYTMAYYQPAGSGSAMDEVTASETFQGGKICSLLMEIILEDSYEFATAVEVTVNGAPCTMATVDSSNSGKLPLQHDWTVLKKSLFVSGAVTGGKAEVEVENLPAGKVATLMVAQYRGGQMISLKTQNVNADGTFSFSGFAHKEGDTYKTFLVNSGTTAPMCEAAYLLID